MFLLKSYLFLFIHKNKLLTLHLTTLNLLFKIILEKEKNTIIFSGVIKIVELLKITILLKSDG